MTCQPNADCTGSLTSPTCFRPNATLEKAGSIRWRVKYPSLPSFSLADGSSETSFATVLKLAPALTRARGERLGLVAGVLLGVEQDVRRAHFLGGAIALLVHRVELVGARHVRIA